MRWNCRHRKGRHLPCAGSGRIAEVILLHQIVRERTWGFPLCHPARLAAMADNMRCVVYDGLFLAVGVSVDWESAFSQKRDRPHGSEVK